jgi:hypothetical protein
VINWNGTPLATTFNYQTGTLSATLTPTQLATDGVALVTVTTAAPGGGTSHSAKFYIGNAPTSIGIVALTSSVDAGSTRSILATVYDQDNVPMATQPLLTWKTDGKANTISPTGVFSAGSTTGVFSAIASYAGLSNSATVKVSDFSVNASTRQRQTSPCRAVRTGTARLWSLV